MVRGLVLALVAVFLSACGDEAPLQTPDREVCLMRRDNARYCIEVYEASRKDATSSSQGMDKDSPPRSLDMKMPWVDITWSGARTACEAKGKRLCERDEWVDACDGMPGEDLGTKYTYGDTLDMNAADPALSICNTAGAVPSAGGAHPMCRSAAGTYDQSGNVWEWTGGTLAVAAARGGGFRSSVVHECKSGDGMQLYPPDQPSHEVGFRCCRD